MFCHKVEMLRHAKADTPVAGRVEAERSDGPARRSTPAGTSGPFAASTLIERDGRSWHE